MVIWTLTPVELTSAIRRLVREGRLGEEDARRAEERANELSDSTDVVVVTDVERIKSLAPRLLRVHPLKAADAVQLAAALAWSNDTPEGQIFYTFDRALARAARLEGFTVFPDSV
jgi:predicted nucleic acid-binding protein